MSSQALPKMSLVAQYDDLCRYTKVLTSGCEEEFKIFVENQRDLFRKFRDLEAEIEDLRKKNCGLETEKKRFECQINQMKRLVEEEVINRKKLEQDKSSMERQIALIKEVLLADGNTIDNQTKEKLFILSNTTCKQPMDSRHKLATIEESMGSLLSQSDIDDTDDDLDINISHRRKRRSRGNKRSSSEQKQKKKKSEEKIQTLDLNEEFTMDVDIAPSKREVTFRSSSEPRPDPSEQPLPRQIVRSDSEQIKGRSYDLRMHNTGTLTPKGTPMGRYSTGGKLSRSHAFVSKTVIRLENPCLPCGKNLKFCKTALKCTDCRIVCHPECKDLCPLPCIPTNFTPTGGNVKKDTIAYYTSSTGPMIPALIVHCVNEIESRGLSEIGIYRMSSTERAVKDLKQKFTLPKGGCIPTLSRLDIHTICGTVKEFLRSLSDSLIPRAARHKFVDAAEMRDERESLDSLYSAVCELPQPNKETLAFLILHFQRVAASPECKMPLENLAKVVGPTIVGYSTSGSADTDKMYIETEQQYRVMLRLLMIPAELWESILSLDYPEVFNPQIKSPELTPVPHLITRLGPIESNMKSKTIQVVRTPLTPRSTKHSSKGGRRQYFTSPLLP